MMKIPQKRQKRLLRDYFYSGGMIIPIIKNNASESILTHSRAILNNRII